MTSGRGRGGSRQSMYGFEWTELAFQEKLAGNTRAASSSRCACCSSGSSHSAEYESFALSTAIILIVPMCLLAASAACG